MTQTSFSTEPTATNLPSLLMRNSLWLDAFIVANQLITLGLVSNSCALTWHPLTPRPHLAPPSHIRSPGNWLAYFTHAANCTSSSWSPSSTRNRIPRAVLSPQRGDGL